MKDLQIVELMLLENQFFTDAARFNTRRCGRDSMRVLPPGRPANGSELAGRSRIRRFLLPEILESITRLLSEPLLLERFVPVHTHTVLTFGGDPDVILLKGLWGCVTGLEADIAGESGEWDPSEVGHNIYMVRKGKLGSLTRQVIEAQVGFVRVNRGVSQLRTRRRPARKRVILSPSPSAWRETAAELVWRVLVGLAGAVPAFGPTGAGGSVGCHLRSLSWAWVDGPPNAVSIAN